MDGPSATAPAINRSDIKGASTRPRTPLCCRAAERTVEYIVGRVMVALLLSIEVKSLRTRANRRKHRAVAPRRKILLGERPSHVVEPVIGQKTVTTGKRYGLNCEVWYQLNLAPCSQTGTQKQGQKDSELPWMSHRALLARHCTTDCDFLALSGPEDPFRLGHL